MFKSTNELIHTSRPFPGYIISPVNRSDIETDGLKGCLRMFFSSHIAQWKVAIIVGRVALLSSVNVLLSFHVRLMEYGNTNEMEMILELLFYTPNVRNNSFFEYIHEYVKA